MKSRRHRLLGAGPIVVGLAVMAGAVAVDVENPLAEERSQARSTPVAAPSPASGGDEEFGPTIYESLPGLCGAVRVTDPRATQRSLRELNYTVRWTVVDFGADGTSSKSVTRPPAGTVIISVLSASGHYEDVDPSTKALSVELAPRATTGGHPLARDAACAS